MKKKFSTKTIVISALIVVLLAVGITGTVVFLKDSGEAEAAMEEQENLLPVTGRDDETEGNNEQVEPNEETEGEQAGNQEQNAEETENEETTTNNNQGTTNTNTTNTNTNTNQGNTETELIPTVIGTRERKIAEGLSLGWTTIKIPSIVSNLDIFKPEISIEKTATRVNDEKIKQVVAGDIVVYTIKVENTGNYKANNLIITDLLPVEFAKPEESDSNVTIDNETNQVIINELPAGTAFTIEAAYEVTQEDVDNFEKITNTAIVKYGEEEKEDEDDTVETLRKEDFEIYKTAKIQPREDEITPEKAEIGDKILYTITVKNTGTVTLKNILVADEMLEIEEEIDVLKINETKTLTETYEVTKTDIDRALENEGIITNIAIATYAKEDEIVLEKEDEANAEIKMEYNYTVEYYYDGEKDTTKTDTIEATYQDVINTYTDKNITGYKLEKAENLPLTVSEVEANNVIKVYYVKDNFNYTVEYYYDGEKDTTKTDTIEATYQDVISTYTDKNITGYRLEKAENLPLTVSEVEANNVIKVYYVKDNFNYTVEYYYDGEKDTTKTDTIEATYQDVINTYTDKNITGYKLEKTENLPLTVSEVETNNVIKVYYVKRTDLSYTVNYLEKGTTNVLHEQKVVGNQTYGTVIKSSDEEITIDGYDYDSADKETLTIGTGENVINLYYTKRTDLSYTVNYLEKGTNKVLHDAKKLENQTFGTVITASINNELEVIEKPVAITGYSCVEVDKETMTIGIANNSINFYYTKNEYKYTVEHYWEGLNGQWEKDEISFPDEIKSALYEDIITEYTVHQRDGYVLSHATPPEDNTTNVSLQITENEDTNVIKVYYIRNNFNYTVKHYIEKLDGTWELKDTDTIENVKYGSEATYEPNIYKEYTFDDNKTTPKNATVPANNDLVINLYYTRKLCDYTVNFFIQGEQKPFETYSKSAKLGEVITVSQDEINTTKNQIPNAIIYEYVPGTTSVTIKDGENIINIYYKEIIRTASITENSTTIRKTNLVIVLDLSSSMEKGTTRLANAKSAANKFIDQIYNNETVSGINIKVVTFNSRNPIITSTNYIGITECTDESHYYNWIGHYHKNNTNCIEINGIWYSEYKEEHTYAAFSGTQALPVSGLTNNTATNYSEAQVLKTAINGIYIPSQYQDGGYGTHIYAALQEANTQISSLNTRYQNNESVVVFLGDGVPTSPRNGGDYIDNSNENIASAASILKGNATVYCIRLGKEAQGSTVFNTIATSSDEILDADTEGDLIDGFNAITSSENSRKFTSNNSANGIITITDVDLNIGTEKPLTVTKPDGTIDTFTTIDALNASGYISYTDNIITWDIKNYSKETLLTINYHIN